MAANVIKWSSLVNGQVLTLDLFDPVLNPNGDVLHFDDPAISAADLWYLEANDALTVVTISVGLKRVTLNVNGLTVTTSNVTFADGSVLLVGDNSYGTDNDHAGNTLIGGSRDDQLIGLGGNDGLAGGAGNDVFVDGYGNNTLVGGSGDDFFDVWSEIGSANTATGGLGRDFYYLDDESASLLAPPGSPGHNYLVTDFAVGPGGDEIFVSDLVLISIGYTDQDPFAAGFLRFIQSGPNTIFQGDRDGAAGTTHTWMALITLQNVSASSLTSDNFPDLVIGTAGDDVLTGTERKDLMPGLLGNDTLSGAGDNDYLAGAAGNDVLDGGIGADSMLGGGGNDIYYVDDANDAVVETSNAQAFTFAAVAGESDAPGFPTAVAEGITDTVIAAINYSLANVQLQFVENLTLNPDSTATTGTGNELDNVLTGNALNNTLTGLAGNDTLTGGGGNDMLDGGDGVDAAVFSGNRSSYTIGAAGATVSGPDGTDTLSNIERLQFSNASLAFDLDRGEAAGNTVRLIGAAFGTQFLTPEIIGVVVDIFDAGYTLSELSPVALTVLGSPGNADFVGMIFRNVVEIDPPADTQAALVGLLDSGAMTQAQMLEIVVNLELNETHIGLVGMQQNGVEFV